MAGVFPSETTIYIVAANTNGSALTAADKIIGEITNWARSGGDQDIETIPVIGGFVDKEVPRNQFELKFDVIVQNTAASALDRYDTYFNAGGTATAEGADKAIFIEHVTGSQKKTFAFNNARAVTWEPEMSADDMLKGSISFKLSPTTPLGVSNMKTSALASSTSFFNW